MLLKDVPQRRQSRWRKLTGSRMLLLMCIPAIAFFVIFNYAPLPGIWIAFTNFNYRDGIFGSPFVGFKNFEFLIKSGQMWLLTRNTVLYNLAFIVLGNILAIAFAVMLNEVRLKYFKKFSQGVMFLPYFISVVLVGVIAFNLLNYDNGALNALIEQTGGDPIKIYSTAGVWPFIITAVHLWQSTGYGTIVYFAAIMGIDRGLFEAAAIDASAMSFCRASSRSSSFCCCSHWAASCTATSGSSGTLSATTRRCSRQPTSSRPRCTAW